MDNIFYISSTSFFNKEQLHGVSFTQDCILLDTGGLENYKKSKNKKFINGDEIEEGRFVALLQYNKNEFICKSDAFGQELVFYFHDGKNWAVSNSLLHLAEKLREAGVSLTLYEPTLLSFAISNQSMYGGQLLSHNTPIKEIKLLPYNKQIRLKKNLIRGYSFSIEQKPSSIKPINNLSDYRYNILEFVNIWQSRFEALRDSGVESMSYELSGGYDSRINFALIAGNERTATEWTLLSNTWERDDYRVAAGLAKKYGLSIGKQIRPTVKGTDAEHFKIWKYGNAGHYIPPYMPSSIAHVHAVKIHGANYRGRAYVATSAPKRIEKIKNALPEREGQMVADEFEQSFAEIGIDSIASPTAMHEHYTAFRARIHYGRNWLRRHGNILITPLLSTQLRAMTEWMSIQYPDAHPEQTTCDILHAINPSLAKFPFDKKDKSFPRSTLRLSRSLELPEINQTAEKIKIYGFDYRPKKTTTKSQNRTKKETYKNLLEKSFLDAINDPGVCDMFWKDFIDNAKLEELEGNLSRAGKKSVLINAKIFVDLLYGKK